MVGIAEYARICRIFRIWGGGFIKTPDRKTIRRIRTDTADTRARTAYHFKGLIQGLIDRGRVRRICTNTASYTSAYGVYPPLIGGGFQGEGRERGRIRRIGTDTTPYRTAYGVYSPPCLRGVQGAVYGVVGTYTACTSTYTTYMGLFRWRRGVAPALFNNRGRKKNCPINNRGKSVCSRCNFISQQGR